jgi:hypothetical protein
MGVLRIEGYQLSLYVLKPLHRFMFPIMAQTVSQLMVVIILDLIPSLKFGNKILVLIQLAYHIVFENQYFIIV